MIANLLTLWIMVSNAVFFSCIIGILLSENLKIKSVAVSINILAATLGFNFLSLFTYILITDELSFYYKLIIIILAVVDTALKMRLLGFVRGYRLCSSNHPNWRRNALIKIRWLAFWICIILLLQLILIL